MTPGRLRGLIFDMDGTLADTEEVHRIAFNAAFADAGLPVRWDPAEHRRRLPQGSGKERLAVLFAEPPVSELIPLDQRERRILELHERKTTFFTAEIEAGRAALRPGVLRLIRAAAGRGLKLGVASTAHTRSVHTVLRVGLGPELYSRLAAVYGGNDVTHKKPHPEVYQRCLADLGLRPEEAVAFEDSRLGLRSALAAGLTTVVTYTHWTDDQDFTGAAAVIDQLGDPGLPPVAVRCGPAGFASGGMVGLEDLERLIEIGG